MMTARTTRQKADFGICLAGSLGVSLARSVTGRVRRVALTATRREEGGSACWAEDTVPEKQYAGSRSQSSLQRPTFGAQTGMGVIEIVIAVAIIGIVMFAVYQFAIASSISVQVSARQVEAAYLAEEGIEAVRALRNQSWNTSITPLLSNVTYYPTLTTGTWTLSTTNPGTIDGLFTRTIVIQDVLRDVNDNIAASGTIDVNTRKVTATVSWSEKSTTQQVVLETYLTNFLSN